MCKRLSILIVEDSESDTELIIRQFQKANYDITYERVETDDQMMAAIEKQSWDLVIADYSLPEFNAPAALAILQKSGLDIPFVVVSGAIGEETAIEIMKAGAHDYIMKNNMSRLVPAIERELKEAESRVQRKQAEELLRSEHIMLARTEGIAHIGSWGWNIATDTVNWSDELFRIFQRDPREGAPSFAEHPAFYHPDDMARLRQAVKAAVADGTPYKLELRAIRKDGETRVCVARGVAEMALGGRPGPSVRLTPRRH
jgi:CheY-like chemotaxis protein